MNTQTEEKWRTIPDYPRYVVSNRGRVATKKEGKILTQNKGFVYLFSTSGGFCSRLSVSKIYHKVWFNEKVKKIKGFPNYKITKDGSILNSCGRQLTVVNGSVRLKSKQGKRHVINVEKLKKELWAKN